MEWATLIKDSLFDFGQYLFIGFDEIVPTVRTLISWVLWAKFIVSKAKALPAIIGQVPAVEPSAASQVAAYNAAYNR